MSADIEGRVFFGWLLKDGEIELDYFEERLQEEDGELSDDTSQFTTETIDNPEDHDISDNISDRPFDEDPTESIAEGGQHAVQTGVTAVENTVSGPIYKNALPCSEMELPSHPGAEWEEPIIPKGNSISHNIISEKNTFFISFFIENGIG